MTRNPLVLDDLVQQASEIDPDDPQGGYRAVALLVYMGAVEWVSAG